VTNKSHVKGDNYNNMWQTRYDYNLTIMKSQISQTGHWQQVYKINQKLPLKSNNVELCPKFIPDIGKFLAVAILKMVAKIQHCPISSKFDMLVHNDVPKATARNFSMSGINSGYHNLPTHEMSLKSDNDEFVQYCGGHFENGDR
jgi:hypothetical protein